MQTQLLTALRLPGKRVKKYMEDPNIGVDEVERILDACHAIRFQVPRTPGIKRRDHKQLKKYYEKMIRNDTSGMVVNTF